jgi:hypothetical protein
MLYAIASFAGGPLAFFLLLFPVGIVIGGIEIVLNLEADRTEHMIGHRIMNRAHAFWSFGFFSAGIISALVAQSGLSPQIHLLLMVPLVIVGVALILGRFDPAPHRTGTSDKKPPQVAVPPFLSGFAVALGAGAQAMTRFFADPFVERYSPTAVSRVLLTVLGVGMLLVFFAPSDWLALVGFAPMGVGTSVIFPLAMSAAAQLTDRPAPTNVASLAQISFVAFLLGTATARLCRRAFRHPLVVRRRAAAGHPEQRMRQSAGYKTAEARGRVKRTPTRGYSRIRGY